MLEFQNISITYRRGAPILKELSLAVDRGEIVALLGHNGVGKSSLLGSVMGLVPYTGVITFDGTPTVTLSPTERARRVALLPQRLPAPELTTRDVVAFGLSPHTARLGKAEWHATDAMLARLSLSHLSSRLVSTLSGGERQKVFLAMTLLQSTDYLLLDEPTTHMDPGQAAELCRILCSERDAGKGVLTVMHDLSAAFALADRVAILSDGALVFLGTPAEALEQSIAERVFGVTRYTAKSHAGEAIFFRAE